MMNRTQQYQAGASLMEVLIAMSISLVVTAAMIAMMANSLGTTARIVKMTKLADDLRVTMQMMTRDVRRSSYNARSMFCYGNPDCGIGWRHDPGRRHHDQRQQRVPHLPDGPGPRRRLYRECRGRVQARHRR